MPGRIRPGAGKRRHGALGDELDNDRQVIPGENERKRREKQQRRDEFEAAEGDAGLENVLEAGLMPESMAKKILRQSRQQHQAKGQFARPRGVDEDGADEDFNDEDDDGDDAMLGEDDDEIHTGGPIRGAGGDDDVDEEDDELVELDYDDTESMAESEMVDFGEIPNDFELDEEEARLLGKFQPQAPTQSRNLADIIMEKIREKEQAQVADAKQQHSGASEMGESRMGDGQQHIDNRVRRVYVAIGRVLKSYTAGKIPKAFKILPRVQNWEQLILLTKPEDWSPHATYAATRIFAAALNERMAQRFYTAVLLPIVHNYIGVHKHLHPAMYQALRKALFKPIAFFKGFLLPLCAGGECALREAMIVGSVLQKMHLHPIPTAVVIVKICEMPFSSNNTLILRVLIDKRLALPFQAVDALVAFFHRTAKAHRNEKLPVLWHQAMLSFAQRYKAELKPEQTALLLECCDRCWHAMITPETRRELNAKH